MRPTTSLLLLAGISLAALALTPNAATACFTCTASQECTKGDQGSSCTQYIGPDGKQYCQFTTDCGLVEITMTPLQVSPTGTYLPSGGASLTEDGKLTCNGFIVAHQEPAADASRSTLTI